MTLLAVFLATTLVVLGWIRFEGARRAKKIEQAFAGRDALSPQQFYERFFKEQGIPLPVVEGVREVLQTHLGADMSRLVDGDDFSSNLSFFWDYDSLADVAIVQALENRFRIKITAEEAAATRTVRDLIELVWNKLRRAEDLIS